jgi:large subunit ribosomal protein L17
VIARLNDLEAASILFDVIAPQSKRNSGYLRIERAGYRRGDNSEMGTISFVDEFDFAAPVKEEKAKKADVKAKADKKSEKEAK